MKFDSIQQFFFLGLLLTSTGAFLWILGPYIIPGVLGDGNCNRLLSALFAD